MDEKLTQEEYDKALLDAAGYHGTHAERARRFDQHIRSHMQLQRELIELRRDTHDEWREMNDG